MQTVLARGLDVMLFSDNVSLEQEVLLKTTAGPLDILRGTAAHAVAGMAGCLFVFLTSSCVRTIAAFARPGGVAARMLPVAQFALVLCLLATLFALPGLASRTRHAIESGSGLVLALPWSWFLGVEETLSGRHSDALAALSRTASRNNSPTRTSEADTLPW